jgi:hypothetical protein
VANSGKSGVYADDTIIDFLEITTIYDAYRKDSTQTSINDVWDPRMRDLLNVLIKNPDKLMVLKSGKLFEYKLSKGQSEILAQLDRDLRGDIAELKKSKIGQDNDTIERLEKRIDGYFSSVMGALTNTFYS